MKRFLMLLFKGGVAAALLFCANAPAAQLLQQNLATQVPIKFVDATDGFTAETALTVTTFDCNLIKHADSSLSATALTVTTAGGGTNDAAHLADGIYSLELNATDTNTVGRLDLYCQCSGARPYEAHYEVVASGVYTQQTLTASASIDDFMETDCSTVASTTSAMGMVCSNLDGKVSEYSIIKNKTTIATLASQTSFTLSVGSVLDDAYNGWMVVVQAFGVPETFAAGVVSDYEGATKTITLRTDPAVFTMGVGDIVYLVPDRGLKPSVDNRVLVVDAAGLADGNMVKVGPTGSGTAQTAKDLGATLGTPTGASISADVAAVKVDTAAVKVKTDFLPSASAGAAGGLFIAGSNAATSVTTALTANITGNLSGSIGSVATGGIAAASFAAGAVDAAAIAADAVGSSELAATAVAEIQAGLLTVPKNVAYSFFTFKLFLVADGSAGTGLTPTCTISKDGAAFAACTNVGTIAEIGSTGVYKVDLTQTEMNADEIWLTFGATGARAVDFKIRTLK